MLRHIDEGLEHFRHGRIAEGGAGGDDLRGEAGLRPRHRPAQEISDVTAAIAHPVAGEEMLVLPHHRPLETHQYVDPEGELRLGQEFGISAVLAAAIDDAVVDDGDIHTPGTAELGRVRGSLLMYDADKIQAVI
ncbi:hypothetical protein AB3G45_03490 [Shinella sp. S4-D37]|uniref:hypothetical protein n=1 Tax=Shinella sp. S4-D37 TaxID=3161999 RepID=UPI003464EA30